MINEEPVQVFTSNDADADFKAGKYRFIIYGLESVPDYNHDSLVAAFGFYYENQGCEVTEKSKRGAEEYNLRMEYLLQQRLGKHWKKEFEWKCDSLQHEFYLAHKNDSNYY